MIERADRNDHPHGAQPPQVDPTPEHLTAINASAEAAGTLQKRKKLTLRMRDYAATLQTKIDATVRDKDSGKEVSQLTFIRRALLWAFKKAITGTAWLLDQIEKLAGWIADMLGTAARPITGTYTKVKSWVKGAEEHEAVAA